MTYRMEQPICINCVYLVHSASTACTFPNHVHTTSISLQISSPNYSIFNSSSISTMATISLILAVAALCSSAAAQKPDLAIEVCRSTTDFAFCRAAVYSDPRTPGADRYELIDIIFREAYRNASDTRGYIAGEIKSGGGGGLKKCLADYEKAVQILEGMLNDLNSESYYDLVSRSLDVERSARDCGKGLRGRSPLAQRNRNMLKFANMCYAVSKLF